MFKPDARLKALYLKYNKAFFDGALPVDTIVGYSEEISDALWGLTVSVETEEAKHRYFCIYLDPVLKPPEMHRMRKMVLLHEMCHAKLCPNMRHGKLFEEEMTRLAIRGAFKGIW